MFLIDNLEKKTLKNKQIEIQYYSKEDTDAQAVICSKNDIWLEPNTRKKIKIKFKNVFMPNSLKKEAYFVTNKRNKTIIRNFEDQIVDVVALGDNNYTITLVYNNMDDRKYRLSTKTVYGNIVALTQAVDYDTEKVNNVNDIKLPPGFKFQN
eukprot:Pgem_evm3s18099